MDFAQQQRDPRKHLAGISTVIILHVIVIYALTNGLARKVVDVLKKPLEVNIIEELKTEPPPPPPPPPKTVPPPRQIVEPPPAYVPPPEVQVQPPPSQPVIAVTTAAPPPPVVVVAPPPVVVPPPVTSVSVACPNYRDVVSRLQPPVQVQRMGLSGDVLVEFTVSPTGVVGDIKVTKSSNSIFNAVAIAAVAKFQCVGQGQGVRVRLPIGFEQEH